MSNRMNADERAALVKRLRSRDGEDLSRQDEKNAASLIEADGKRLALAEKTIAEAPHEKECRFVASNYITQYIIGDVAHPCTCWKAEYDAAKEAGL